MDIPDNWGTAEYDILAIDNFNTNDKPTVVTLILTGFVRGIDYTHETKLVCDCKTHSDLAEEITNNVLYPWIESLISQQKEAEL